MVAVGSAWPGWFRTSCGPSWRPCSRPRRPTPVGDGRGLRIEKHSRACSSSCGAAVRGRSSGRNSGAAAGVPVGGACATGTKPRLAPPRAHPAPAPERCRPDRWVAGQSRLDQRAGKKGGAATGPNPTDRGQAGAKRHLVVDGQGIPLATLLSAANGHASVLFAPLLEAIPPPGRPFGQPGRPRSRPAKGARGQGVRHPALPAFLRDAPPRLPHCADRH